MNNLILTTALPYANGDLHIGHIYEAVLADIKSRTYKKYNKEHTFVSGADCHGSATTIFCRKNNINIEDHLTKQYDKNKELYDHFDISFNFSRTDTLLHKFVVNECLDLIFENKSQLGNILETRDVLGWFDDELKQFLPDRYIKGTCPYCSCVGQVEICDKCQKKIEDKDLINPKSTVSNGVVYLKANKHLVLNSEKFYDNLLSDKDKIPASIREFVLSNKNDNGYIDISREKPYYGIEIHKDYIDVKEQCFYVWFDAPIAYVTFAYENYLLEHKYNESRDDFRKFLKQIKFEHVIGKDIIYFHTFLWFNLLKHIVGKNIVEKINVHGWITQNNDKFSKRNGAALDTNLSKREVRELRLFFFSKFNGTQTDIEFDDNEVKKTYTTLVVNKFGNFYTRSIKLLEKHGSIKYKDYTLNSLWLEQIEQGNYRDLYVWLDNQISNLNSKFSDAQLWKEENSALVIENLENWLNQWRELYSYLCLIIPEFSDNLDKINKGEFFYLDQR